MDAIPEKVLYVPLPRLRILTLARQLKTATSTLVGTAVGGTRRRWVSRKVTATWLAQRTRAAWTLGTALSLAGALRAMVSHRRRTWQIGHRAVGTWRTRHAVARMNRSRLGRHSGRRSVEMWWAAHTLETTVWTLAVVLALGLGVVVARL
jgi:hypothetical protein